MGGGDAGRVSRTVWVARAGSRGTHSGFGSDAPRAHQRLRAGGAHARSSSSAGSSGDLDVELFAKLEAFNPGGSVKDRIGVAMIEAAEREGRIEPGRTTIVEATSGNTGIALAFVCAAKGYELILTLPQGMSREREGLLRLYGARVDITESLGGMTEAVDAARALATRDDVFLPDQFSNPANPEIHRRTTGPELWEALDGRIDVFVAGVGTGGTMTGVGEVLKAAQPRLPRGRRGAAQLGGALGRAARGRTRSRGSAPGSCRRCSTASCWTR